MTSLRLLAVLVMFAHAISAREIRSTSSVTVRAPANLTYEELVYIFQMKHGHAKEKPKHLTPCARAILGCCKDNVMNAHCSEMLKCGEFFFDDNPCDDKFIIDALNAAKIFYDRLS